MIEPSLEKLEVEEFRELLKLPAELTESLTLLKLRSALLKLIVNQMILYFLYYFSLYYIN